MCISSELCHKNSILVSQSGPFINNFLILLIFFVFTRGTLSVHDLTVGAGCRLLFSTTGNSLLLNDTVDTRVDVTEGALTGHYRFDSLTIADDGEVTMVDDGDELLSNFTLTVGKLHIQGGGHMHAVCIRIPFFTLVT